MAKTKKRAKSTVVRTRIKEVMDKGGVTQYFLAKETGMSYITIHSYYHGRSLPSLEALYSIAQVLKVDPKDLLV